MYSFLLDSELRSSAFEWELHFHNFCCAMAAAVARPATPEHAAPAQAATGACGAHGPPHTAAKEQSQLDAYNGREDQEHVQSGRELRLFQVLARVPFRP